MRRNALFPLALVAAALLSGGCILPIPVYYVHTRGVQGTVVDAETGLPIRDAVVYTQSGGGRSAVTDADGSYAIPADSDWHFGYCFEGCATETCIPNAPLSPRHGKDEVWDITVSAPGYRTLETDRRNWNLAYDWNARTGTNRFVQVVWTDRSDLLPQESHVWHFRLVPTLRENPEQATAQ